MGLLALTAMANASAESYAGKNYAIATVLFLRVLPALVMGPIAGYVADRLDRRRTLIWGDYLRGALFLTIPIVGHALVDLRGDRAGRGGQPGVGARQGRHRPEPGAPAPARGGEPDQPRHDLRLGPAGGRDLRRADPGRQVLPARLRRLHRRPGRPRAVLQRALLHRLRLRHHPAASTSRGSRVGRHREQRVEGDRRGLEVRRHHARRTRPGDRHRRGVRRRRRGDRAGPHLRLRPRRRRLRLRRAVRHRLRGPGARHVAAARGCSRGCPGAGCSASRSRSPACCCSRSRWSSSCPSSSAHRRARLLRRRRLDHRQHDARPRGPRRGARADLRVRRLDDPARAGAGAGRVAAAGRADRHPRPRPAGRERRPLPGLQRCRVHVPDRRRADDGCRCGVLPSDGRPERSLPDDRPAARLHRVGGCLLRHRVLRRVRGRRGRRQVDPVASGCARGSRPTGTTSC